MKYRIPAPVFLYDYGGLFARVAVTAAIAVVVFTALFSDVM